MNGGDALLELSAAGLYSPAGGFHIDPWAPVERALITHAHPDRAHPGSQAYLTARAGEALLRAIVGPGAAVEAVDYGERITMAGAVVSFHPAGHMAGSAQIRIERGGEVWVAAGDYKLAPNPACATFEPLRCHVFVTEAVFALPVFRWPAEAEAVAAMEAWWRSNIEAGRNSLLFCDPLGKAQRLLARLDASIGPIVCHEAIERINVLLGQSPRSERPGKWPIVLAPLSARNTPWVRRFAPASTALASGWMRIRGTRRRRSLDRGFVLSDHADWPELHQAIDQTGAETVWVTHGFRAPLARWLEEHGRRAIAIETRFEGERDDAALEPAP